MARSRQTQQYVCPHGVVIGFHNVRQHKTQSKSETSISAGFTWSKTGLGSIPAKVNFLFKKIQINHF